MAGLFRKKKRKKNRKLSKNKTFYAVTCDKFRLVPSNYQHIGSRKAQEDAFALSDLANEAMIRHSGVLAVVADGMGGLAHGDEASSAAVDTFMMQYAACNGDIPEPIPQCLDRALLASNEAVFSLALQQGKVLAVGTTLVAAVIYHNQLHWISVGDSRIYHCRNGQARPLNKDHIYANKLLEDVLNNRITRSEAENHPERGYLTSYLGIQNLPEIDRSEEPLILEPGDTVMLCSDGLYNTLSDNEIMETLQNSSVHTAELLVETVLSRNNPHQDNVTAVVLSCLPHKK